MTRWRAVGALLALCVASAAVFWVVHRHARAPVVTPPPAPVVTEPVPQPITPAPEPQPKPHPHTRTAVISGLVLDPEGHPVEHAIVSGAPAWTSNSRYAIADARTNAGGAFNLEGIEPGERVAITVSAPSEGGEPPTWPPLNETVEAPAHSLRLQFSEGLSLEGSVLDGRGREQGGVKVSLQFGEAPPWHAQTDSHGSFRFEHLAAGHYRICARSPAGPLNIVTEDDVAVRLQAPPVTLRIPSLGALSGSVVDDDGHPVASAAVEISASRDEVASGHATGTVRTGPDGSFSVDVPTQSHVSLTVENIPGYEDAAGSADAGDSSVRIVVKRETTVSGRVLGREHTPLTLFRINGHEMSAADGRFRLSSKALQESQLRIDADEYAETGIAIPTHDRKSLDLGDIVLNEGRTIVGRVYDGSTNAPLEGAAVGWALDCEHSPVPRRCTRTDEDGRFTLLRVPNTIHSLWIEHEHFLKGHAELTDAPMYVEVTLDRGASIQGHVLSAAGHPVAGMKVQAESDASTGVATTDHAGRFSMSALAAGSYIVKTFADDGILPLRVTVGEHETAQVELRPPPPGTRVLLRVVDSDGAPVAVTDAWAMPGDIAQEINNSDVANAHRIQATAYEAAERGGELVLQHIPPGEVTVVVERGGTPFATVETVPAKSHYELTVHVPEAFCEIGDGDSDSEP